MTEMAIPKTTNVPPDNSNNTGIETTSLSDLAHPGDSNPSSSTILICPTTNPNRSNIIPTINRVKEIV